jgi:hypothetical protein
LASNVQALGSRDCSVRMRQGLEFMQAGRYSKRLAVSLITAVVTVATGIAINAAFVTDRSLIIWPWLSAAVGLALVQVFMTGPKPPPDGSSPPPRADSTIRSSEADRHTELAAHFREVATQHVPLRPMPIAWKTVANARNRDAESPIVVTDAAAIGEYFLRETPHRLVVLGEPGCGKTSLAWRIALDIARSDELPGLIPIVRPIGSWNPFETYFDDWLEERLSEIPELSASGLTTVTEILPILDGFDEYSTQLLGEALGILGNMKYSSRPLVVLSRPDQELAVSTWRDLLSEAAVIELMPLPVDEIIRYIETAPRGAEPQLSEIVRELRDKPAGIAAQVLSSPFMLDIAVRKYAYVYPGDFLTRVAAGDPSKAEDLLASYVLEWRIRDSSRWRDSNPRRWLDEIARRAPRKFMFRPNELDIPSAVMTGVLIIAAALPAVTMIVVIPVLPLLLGFAIAVSSGLIFVFGSYTGNGPTIDPRDELNLERRRAKERAVIAFIFTAALGFLGVVAPYVGEWTLGIAAALGALAGTWGEPNARTRFYGSAAGALCGPIFGWAAYAGTQFDPSWRFVIPGIAIGAFAFIVIFAVNLIGHVSTGTGREGLLTAPFVAAAFALPVGLLAGSVLAVATLSQLGFSVIFIDRLGGVIIFSVAVACAILLTTLWSRILISRTYYAARGVFPLRLLRFLEDFAELRVLRRVGYSYEFKHPALLRVVKCSKAAPDDEQWI